MMFAGRLLAVVLGSIFAGPLSAEDIVPPREGPRVPPFPVVESRFSRPPVPGAQKRIRVQINVPTIVATAPESPSVAPAMDSDDEAAPEVVVAVQRDFWDLVSPSMADSRPGRLSMAMEAISTLQSVRRPRLQALQDIATAHGISILSSTVGTNISPALVLALISVESAGQTKVVSHAGAQGLMQLMPATAKRFGVKNSFDAHQNIQGGVAYLDWLMGKFDGDPLMVLASYNAGEGAVQKHDGVPPYEETRNYVPKVLAAFEVARALCATPPELISDGCVFVTMQQ